MELPKAAACLPWHYRPSRGRRVTAGAAAGHLAGQPSWDPLMEAAVAAGRKWQLAGILLPNASEPAAPGGPTDHSLVATVTSRRRWRRIVIGIRDRWWPPSECGWGFIRCDAPSGCRRGRGARGAGDVVHNVEGDRMWPRPHRMWLEAPIEHGWVAGWLGGRELSPAMWWIISAEAARSALGATGASRWMWP